MLGLSLFPVILAQASPAPISPLEKFLSLLVNPSFTWLLVIAIVGFALYHWYRFSSVGLGRCLRQLREGTRSLQQLTSAGSFSQQFKQIDETMLQNPLLKKSWSHYTDSLLMTPTRDTVRSSREPQYYFNDNLLSNTGLNLRFYHAVPSYLVALGLLCTFLGLVAALFIASIAMDQDPQTIKSALQRLLQAASFKFITSIAGLGTSIYFSYRMKDRLMQWQTELEEFCSQLLTAAPVITTEAIAYESLGEIQKQNGHLARIQAELAGQVATAIDDRLHANLVTLVDPLTKEIAQVTQRLSNISQEAVARMVQDFREQLFAATQEQMGQLVGGLQQTNHALERMDRAITSSAEHFSTQISQATVKVYDRISDAAGAFANSLDPLQDQISALNVTFGKVDAQFKSQLELFSAALSGMRESLTDFRTTAATLTGASVPIQAATLELEAVARRIHESNVASMNALEQLARFSESLNLTAQQTRETWDVYRQRFEKVDEDLKGVVEQLGEGFRRYHDIVESFMKQLDQSLSHSTSVLSSSVQELADTLETMDARKGRTTNE